MFQPSAESLEIMSQYNVTYRCVVRSGAVQKDEKGRVLRDDNNMPMISPARHQIEIIDLDTNQIYLAVDGEGADGVNAALAMVPSTPKPKTRAQLLVEQGANTTIELKNQEIEKLRREKAELEARLQERADSSPAADAPADAEDEPVESRGRRRR